MTDGRGLVVRVEPAGMDADMGQEGKGAETRLEGTALLSRCWASALRSVQCVNPRKREGKGREAKLWIDLL